MTDPWSHKDMTDTKTDSDDDKRKRDRELLEILDVWIDSKPERWFESNDKCSCHTIGYSRGYKDGIKESTCPAEPTKSKDFYYVKICSKCGNVGEYHQCPPEPERPTKKCCGCKDEAELYTVSSSPVFHSSTTRKVLCKCLCHEPERVSDDDLGSITEEMKIRCRHGGMPFTYEWLNKITLSLQELQKYRRGECRSCGAIPGQLHDKTCPTQNHPQASAG